jgi:putative hydrolase of the HAD superfamily
MYHAIFYDLDGVIRHWDEAEARAIERQFALPDGAIPEAAFEKGLLERALTGRIPDETWRLAARNAIARAHGPEAAAALDAWSERIGTLDAEMVALVAGYRRRLRTGLITNATTRLETDLQAHRLDQAFDVVINSARIGFAKPDPRLFRVAAVRIGYRPEQCIFIDDQPGHVATAREVGMTGIDFKGTAALRETLASLVGPADA